MASDGPTIQFRGQACAAQPGESVLETLERHGFNIANSCRSGICQSCALRAADGEPPADAQKGLSDAWRTLGVFLSCVCRPTGDMDVAEVDDALTVGGVIGGVERLTPTVARITLTPDAPLGHRAGQFVTLIRDDGLARPYSIASGTDADTLELHVRLVPDGVMSTWLLEEARPGTRISLRGPHGTCFYVPGSPARPLLLAGTGTGLAPLWGIARDAVALGHSGPITIYHGGRTPARLYMGAELAALARQHANVTVRRFVLEGAQGHDDVEERRLDDAVLAAFNARDKDGPQPVAFLCGDPTVVRGIQRRLFLGGLALRDIHADAFVPSAKSP